MLLDRKLPLPFFKGQPAPGWLVQAVKFLCVGAGNTALDAALYLLLTRAGGWLFALPVVAKGFSYGAGMVNSFYWNKTWTFRSARQPGRVFPAFALANLAALAANAGVMAFALSALHLSEAPAFVLATAVSFALNFCLTKFFVFGEAR